MAKKAGRKGKYTPEIVRDICAHIENGLSARDACTLVDIGESTYFDWLATKPEFVEITKKSIQIRKESLLQNVRRDRSWKSSAWLLSRLHRDEFSSVDEARLNERIDKLEKLLEQAIGSK